MLFSGKAAAFVELYVWSGRNYNTSRKLRTSVEVFSLASLGSFLIFSRIIFWYSLYQVLCKKANILFAKLLFSVRCLDILMSQPFLEKLHMLVVNLFVIVQAEMIVSIHRDTSDDKVNQYLIKYLPSCCSGNEDLHWHGRKFERTMLCIGIRFLNALKI